MDVNTLIQLKPEEEILEVVNESLWPNAHRFAFHIILLAIPFFFLFPLWRAGLWGVFFFLLAVLVTGGLLYRVFMKWSRTVFIVTDRRVIDHEQRGVFSRVVSEARFHQMDEVTYRVKGLFPTLFRYGDVRLQLQGNAADIEYRHIRRPARIADLINDLRDEA